jgi:exopolysaccharide biosynthesis polyprenyl glycosylphosphotransferase
METVASQVEPQVSALPELGFKQVVRPRAARRLQWRLFTLGLILVDAVLAALALRLTYWIRFEWSLSLFQLDSAPRPLFYDSLTNILVVIWVITFALMGLYNRHNLLGGTKEYDLIFRATTLCPLFVIIASFLEPGFVISRAWLLMAWIFTFLLIALGRFAMRRVVYGLRRHGLFVARAIIVGANREGLSLAYQLLGWRTSGLHIVGFIDKKLPAGMSVGPNLWVLGSVEQLDWVVQQYSVEEVVLASSAFSSRDHLLGIFQRYGISPDVNVRLSSGLYEIITTGLTIHEFAYVPLVRVNQVRLAGADEALKFFLDYAITVPGLILLAPFLLLITLIIKLDSPGPVLYRRRVMGVNGRQFDAYKFRTMHVNGDDMLAGRPELRDELARNHKLKNDPRITRIGRLLRRASLDELPQLFNVVRREMSLVGPRMISPAEMEKYHRWGINLLTVKPGITGLWQVSGRSEISYEERVQLDMYYIRNWSLWQDLQLLWQTIPAVIRGTGAY